MQHTTPTEPENEMTAHGNHGMAPKDNALGLGEDGDFGTGTFMVEGPRTHVAFDLPESTTALLATFVHRL